MFGVSDVFLNGETNDIRGQETNFGNLIADANLAAGQSADPDVLVSILSGSAIRSSIGSAPPGGPFGPSPIDPITGAPAGAVTQRDIQDALPFNNGLSLFTLSPEQLLEILEHGVSEAGEDNPGFFPQVSGVKFSYDPNNPVGSRIANVAIFDPDGTLTPLVMDGDIVAGAPSAIRTVTTEFLASGGEDFPFGEFEFFSPVFADVVQLRNDGSFSGAATFSPDGTQQDALAEYLNRNFPIDGTPFMGGDTTPEFDQRIQNLEFRGDTVFTNEEPGGNGDDDLGGSPGDDTPDAGDPGVGNPDGGSGDDDLGEVLGRIQTSFGQQLLGTGGNDTLNGTLPSSLFAPGRGSDSLFLNGGGNGIVGTPFDLLGDTADGFGESDRLLFLNVDAFSNSFFIQRGSAIISVYENGNQIVGPDGSTLRLNGDFDGGTFLGASFEGGLALSYVDYLPSLKESQGVSSDAINGVTFSDFMTGDGTRSLTLTFNSANSAYANTLGSFEVAPDGTVSNIQVIFANTHDVAAGTQFDLGTPASGNEVGFFLVPNGGNRLDDPASFSPGDPAAGVVTFDQLSQDRVFYSFDEANQNGRTQVLTGSAEGAGNSLIFGFEDRKVGGNADNDFQDVVFTVTSSEDFVFM